MHAPIATPFVIAFWWPVITSTFPARPVTTLTSSDGQNPDDRRPLAEARAEQAEEWPGEDEHPERERQCQDERPLRAPPPDLLEASVLALCIEPRERRREPAEASN